MPLDESRGPFLSHECFISRFPHFQRVIFESIGCHAILFEEEHVSCRYEKTLDCFVLQGVTVLGEIKRDHDAWISA